MDTNFTDPNPSINFTSTRGGAPRLRFRRFRDGIDVDLFAGDDRFINGRRLDEKDVKDLVQFLAPSEPVSAAEPTTTERVAVGTWHGFKVGDTVVEINPLEDVVVERQVPVKPAEPEYGHGDAYVFGMVHRDVPQGRYQGFLSKSGWFHFLSPQGDQRTARESQYEAFIFDEG